MTKVCRECDEPTAEPIAVALEHVASTAGRVVYLCPVCRFVLGLLPLDQHPKGSDGRVRYEEEMPA
ncbi:hypothetical protein ACFWY6_19905 [Streptomyces sp. NPDC059037]|uniref:hypothetical protein n=1 Tax=Streptomyces sp. NPDC059037 TaxID=3346710 RepID=UPI0036A2A657